MTKFSREDVLKLARLARITLTEAEVEEFRKEIGEILQYVEQLQKADVGGLVPTSQVTGLTNVMRDDVVVDYGVAPEDLVRLAPARLDGQLKVKRMIG